MKFSYCLNFLSLRIQIKAIKMYIDKCFYKFYNNPRFMNRVGITKTHTLQITAFQ